MYIYIFSPPALSPLDCVYGAGHVVMLRVTFRNEAVASFFYIQHATVPHASCVCLSRHVPPPGRACVSGCGFAVGGFSPRKPGVFGNRVYGTYPYDPWRSSSPLHCWRCRSARPRPPQSALLRWTAPTPTAAVHLTPTAGPPDTRCGLPGPGVVPTSVAGGGKLW